MANITWRSQARPNFGGAALLAKSGTDAMNNALRTIGSNTQNLADNFQQGNTEDILAQFQGVDSLPELNALRDSGQFDAQTLNQGNNIFGYNAGKVNASLLAKENALKKAMPGQFDQFRADAQNQRQLNQQDRLAALTGAAADNSMVSVDKAGNVAFAPQSLGAQGEALPYTPEQQNQIDVFNQAREGNTALKTNEQNEQAIREYGKSIGADPAQTDAAVSRARQAAKERKKLSEGGSNAVTKFNARTDLDKKYAQEELAAKLNLVKQNNKPTFNLTEEQRSEDISGVVSEYGNKYSKSAWWGDTQGGKNLRSMINTASKNGSSTAAIRRALAVVEDGRDANMVWNEGVGEQAFLDELQSIDAIEAKDDIARSNIANAEAENLQSRRALDIGSQQLKDNFYSQTSIGEGKVNIASINNSLDAVIKERNLSKKAETALKETVKDNPSQGPAILNAVKNNPDIEVEDVLANEAAKVQTQEQQTPDTGSIANSVFGQQSNEPFYPESNALLESETPTLQDAKNFGSDVLNWFKSFDLTKPENLKRNTQQQPSGAVTTPDNTRQVSGSSEATFEIPSAVSTEPTAMHDAIMKAESYQPSLYTDPGGGKQATGYGHNLTPTEKRNQAIVIDGKSHSIGKGKTLSKDAAKKLYMQDMNKIKTKLNQSWSGYGSLDKRDQTLLAEIGFNVGNISKKKWPKLAKALELPKGVKRDKAVLAQIGRSYQDAAGETKQLTSRVNAIKKAYLAS